MCHLSRDQIILFQVTFPQGNTIPACPKPHCWAQLPTPADFCHWEPDATCQNGWVTFLTAELRTTPPLPPPHQTLSLWTLPEAYTTQLVPGPSAGPPTNPRRIQSSRPRIHQPEPVNDLSTSRTTPLLRFCYHNWWVTPLPYGQPPFN